MIFALRHSPSGTSFTTLGRLSNGTRPSLPVEVYRFGDKHRIDGCPLLPFDVRHGCLGRHHVLTASSSPERTVAIATTASDEWRKWPVIRLLVSPRGKSISDCNLVRDSSGGLLLEDSHSHVSHSSLRMTSFCTFYKIHRLIEAVYYHHRQNFAQHPRPPEINVPS